MIQFAIQLKSKLVLAAFFLNLKVFEFAQDHDDYFLPLNEDTHNFFFYYFLHINENIR